MKPRGAGFPPLWPKPSEAGFPPLWPKPSEAGFTPLWPKPSEAGFTLVEVVVALALFALISVAALSLVDTVLNAQRRTDGRLARLAAIDRAMHLIDRDFTALSDGPLFIDNSVSFRRNAAGGPALVGYAVLGGALVRLRGLTPRVLLTDVTRADWRFHRDGVWREDLGERGSPRPDAVALTLTLAGGGTLRRVVPLVRAP